MTNAGGPDYDDALDHVEEKADEETDRELDGASSLHDTDAEVGDEEEVDDTYDIDNREAREAGVNLDGTGEQEPRLN